MRVVLSRLQLQQKQKDNYIKKYKSPKNKTIYRKLSSPKFYRFSASPITAFRQVPLPPSGESLYHFRFSSITAFALVFITSLHH